MKRRKVQKTGGSTYIISLPKSWAKERIKEGDELLIEEEEKSLRIFLEKREKSKKIVLKHEEPLDALLRKIIACYLVGYNKIKIKSEKVIGNKKEIKELVKENIIGLEVTRETSKEIEFQNLLRYSDLTTKQVLMRIDSLIQSMYKDVLNSFESRRKEVLKDVVERENEIDRLYLLGVRQIKSAVTDTGIMKKLNIPSKILCLGYRIIFKSLERIGDHLKSIAIVMLENKDLSLEDLKEIGRDSLDSYKKSIESLFNYDDSLAEEAIGSSKEIDESSKEIKNKRKFKSNLKKIMQSINRTRKLSRDISEIVINLSMRE